VCFAGASTQPRLTIVTQLCSGGELFDRIVKAGHYSESEAAALIDKLGRALHLLHQNRIIHRDIKPENVLYTSSSPDAEPVLADFGLARLQDRPEVHASLVGTPGYLSPEIIRDRVYTPACDVWALGVILYILLCG
jgi:serine/threonine protein kinase